jgi:hypothetical protein
VWRRAIVVFGLGCAPLSALSEEAMARWLALEGVLIAASVVTLLAMFDGEALLVLRRRLRATGSLRSITPQVSRMLDADHARAYDLGTGDEWWGTIEEAAGPYRESRTTRIVLRGSPKALNHLLTQCLRGSAVMFAALATAALIAHRHLLH